MDDHGIGCRRKLSIQYGKSVGARLRCARACSRPASADGFRESARCLVLPDFIGCEREGARRIAFFGDSITQGVRTRPDGYEYWVARIAEGLDPEYSVWNIGSGWARAYDAASDGAWLRKAKHSDVIVIELGVNDISTEGRSAAQVLEDLQTTVTKLKDSRDRFVGDPLHCAPLQLHRLAGA